MYEKILKKLISYLLISQQRDNSGTIAEIAEDNLVGMTFYLLYEREDKCKDEDEGDTNVDGEEGQRRKQEGGGVVITTRIKKK